MPNSHKALVVSTMMSSYHSPPSICIVHPNERITVCSRIACLARLRCSEKAEVWVPNESIVGPKVVLLVDRTRRARPNTRWSAVWPWTALSGRVRALAAASGIIPPLFARALVLFTIRAGVGVRLGCRPDWRFFLLLVPAGTTALAAVLVSVLCPSCACLAALSSV